MLCTKVIQLWLWRSLLLGIIFLGESSLAQTRPDSDQIVKSQQLYQQGKYTEAVELLQKAIATYQTQGDTAKLAATLANLALVYADMGQWQRSNETIAASLELVEALPPQLVAQVLNIHGRILLQQGDAQAALQSWQEAEKLSLLAEDTDTAAYSRINQSRALQDLGLYRRAIDRLQPLVDDTEVSEVRVIALRLLARSLRAVGRFGEATTRLEQSLTVAQQLNLPEQINLTGLELAHLAYARGDYERATDLYREIIANTTSIETRVQTQISLLGAYLQQQQWQQAEELGTELLQTIRELPSTQENIYARIQLGDRLITLHQNAEFDLTPVAALLQQALQQALEINSPAAQAYAVGKLGEIAELQGQWQQAETLTQQALQLSASVNAPEIEYLWQWQLGRIYQATDRQPEAVVAYGGAVDSLQQARNDLVVASTQIQYDFRTQVEPVYRQYVDLLLQLQTTAPQENYLETARQTIEALRLAELDNFFQVACLDATPQDIGQIDSEATVLYPIILPDRLAVIVSRPDQPLQSFSTPVTAQQLEQTINRLLLALGQRNSPRYLPIAQQLYNWLIAPVEEQLREGGVETIVMIPDGNLRNLPLAVLHDGSDYVIENYAVAIAPGLELLPSQPFAQQRSYQVLAGGLSEQRQGFAPLPYVQQEIQQINSLVESRTLINNSFTTDELEQVFSDRNFPVVHLATHGQFSSELDQTFLLTWNGQLNIEDLRQLLLRRSRSFNNPIQLLVLSACETATGDDRAALGLAGIATRAGARSTLASLWQINDRSTAQLMESFYTQLTQNPIGIAEALRRSQLELMSAPQYEHPYYWAAYVLVGNWR